MASIQIPGCHPPAPLQFSASALLGQVSALNRARSGTAQGLNDVRFGENRKMLWIRRSRTTRYCGWGLVPHTGFPVICLMRLTRVHRVLLGDYETYETGSIRAPIRAFLDGTLAALVLQLGGVL